MSIKEEIKEIKTTSSELKKFGITIGIVILLICVLFFYKSNFEIGCFFLGMSAVIIIGALTKPEGIKWFYKFWMTLAVLLSWVMTRVILGVLFYVGFTFIKLIAKISGKEFLDLKIDKNKKSYWIKREQKPFDARDYERQF